MTMNNDELKQLRAEADRAHDLYRHAVRLRDRRDAAECRRTELAKRFGRLSSVILVNGCTRMEIPLEQGDDAQLQQALRRLADLQADRAQRCVDAFVPAEWTPPEDDDD